MSDLARKPMESIHGSFIAPTTQSIDIANEKHYSIGEVAALWSLSEKTVRRMFIDEPGVIKWGSEEVLHKRGYLTIRIPETVLRRVHRKLRKAI